MDKLKRFLTVTEASAQLEVSANTVRRLFDAGDLTGFRLPRRGSRRISRESVERLLTPEAAPQVTTPQHAEG